LADEGYHVAAERDVADDLRALRAVDEQLVRAALALMLELRNDPWLGEGPFQRYNLRPLRDCRKLRFNIPSWKGKPRYRLVYRNEPDDGAPGVVRVWAVGPRADLVAYTRAAARVARAGAAQRRRRRP
jgi:Txe/YoeB family toxin of Txe-Axe toxin-antitoxin module